MKGRLRPCLFFGKLPAHSDFVRHNAAGEEVRAMETWIDEGIYRAGRHFGDRWDAVYQRGAPHFFLFNPETGESVLAGVLKPSRDRSGRKYPFVAARRIESARAREAGAHTLPLACGATLADLETLVLDRSEKLPLPEISLQMDQAADLVSPVSALGDLDRYLRSTSVEDLWASVCAEPRGSNPSILERNVLELARILRAAGSVPRDSGMRFPLSRDLSSRLAEVGFWTKLVLTARPDAHALPTLFWPAGAEEPSPRLLVFLSRPSPRAFLSLVDPDGRQDWILRADGDEGNAPGESDSDRRPGDALARPEGTTLEEFLGRL